MQSPRGSPGLLGTGRQLTWSPASLFIFAVCGSVLWARLGIPAPLLLLLPPRPAGLCRCGGSGGAVPRPQLGTDTRGEAAAPHPALGPALAASPRPGWDTQHFGSSAAARRPKPWGQRLCRSRAEQGSAGDSCSPGGRARSGCLSLSLSPPLPGWAGGWRSRAHSSSLALWAGISVPVGRGAGEHQQLPGKQKPCLHQTAPGVLAQRGPGGGRCPPAPPGSREEPAGSQGSASARGSSACPSGFGNARTAWKQKPQQSRGCCSPQAPSSPRGDPGQGDVAAVTAPSQGTAAKARPGHLWGLIPQSRCGAAGSGRTPNPGAAPAPSPPSLPPSLPRGRGKKPRNVHFQRSFGCKSVYTWRGKIFLSCRVGIFIE